MPKAKRALRVFLSHAHADVDIVRGFYKRLVADGIDVWLDKDKLLPGQNWDLEIQTALSVADVVIICLSKQFDKPGYRQKEIQIAINKSDMQPDGEIFIIPARLGNCKIPKNLTKWHWVDLFELEGYELLMRTLRLQAEKKGAVLQPQINIPNPELCPCCGKPLDGALSKKLKGD